MAAPAHAGVAAVNGRRRCLGGHRGHRHRLDVRRFGATTEANPLLTVTQVDLAEIVVLHQFHQTPNTIDVEDIVRPIIRVRHAEPPAKDCCVAKGDVAIAIRLWDKCRGGWGSSPPHLSTDAVTLEENCVPRLGGM